MTNANKLARRTLARLAPRENELLARIPQLTDDELLAILGSSTAEEMRAVIDMNWHTVQTEADRQAMAKNLKDAGHADLIGYLMRKELFHEC